MMLSYEWEWEAIRYAVRYEREEDQLIIDVTAALVSVVILL